MRLSKLRPEERTTVLEGAAAGLELLLSRPTWLVGPGRLTEDEVIALEEEEVAEQNPWLVIRALRYWIDGLREERKADIARGGDAIQDEQAFSLAMLYTSALEWGLRGTAMLGRKGTVWVRFADGSELQPYAMIARAVYEENTLLLHANLLRERLKLG